MTDARKELNMSVINLTVNGQPHTVDVDPATPLLYVLSDDLAMRGPKFGCGLGPVRRVHGHRERRSRSLLLGHRAVGGRSARSRRWKGLGRPRPSHPIQQAFIDEQAMQCGFCLNGVIMTAKAFVDRTPRPQRRRKSDRRCPTVLCRCLHAHTDGAQPSSVTHRRSSRRGGRHETHRH